MLYRREMGVARMEPDENIRDVRFAKAANMVDPQVASEPVPFVITFGSR